MRAARITLIALAALVLIAGTSTTQAFHDGGVAECVGCHSMHNPNQAGGPGSSNLLNAFDQSSTCLDCHTSTATAPDSYHIATDDTVLTPGVAPYQLSPGGDFAWLKKTYTWSPGWNPSLVFSEEGETHGHNIVAQDYNYVADTTATAPGGTMPSQLLGCQSCHDPHGRSRRDDTGTYVVPAIGIAVAPIIDSGSYDTSEVPGPGEAVGAYRLLGGVGYGTAGINLFTVPPPMAVAPSGAFPTTTGGYNRSEAATQTVVAYGQGMGDWCSTCHTNFHSGTTSRFVHPTNQSIDSGTPSVRAIYNAYIKSGDLTGSQTDSYLSLVPYEEVALTWAELQTLAGTSGGATLPGPNDNEEVMCLSCHRAHASGWEYGMRWNPESEFLTYQGLYPGNDTAAPSQFGRGRTSAEIQYAYYQRPPTVFATYQRSLCNKCHAKD